MKFARSGRSCKLFIRKNEEELGSKELKHCQRLAKTSLYFTSEFCCFRRSKQCAFCSQNLLKLNMKRQRSIPNEDTKLATVVRVLQNTQNLVFSRCCCAAVSKEMYEDF